MSQNLRDLIGTKYNLFHPILKNHSFLFSICKFPRANEYTTGVVRYSQELGGFHSTAFRTQRAKIGVDTTEFVQLIKNQIYYIRDVSSKPSLVLLLDYNDIDEVIITDYCEIDEEDQVMTWIKLML